MKSSFAKALLFVAAVFACVACHETTTLPLECKGEGSYKFAECTTCCMCFRANMGDTFENALDSLQQVDKPFFQDLVSHYDVDSAKSYLQFDTLHVLNFTLDERQFIQVSYYAYIEEYKESMPIFDYGVVDTKGDVYIIKYPND